MARAVALVSAALLLVASCAGKCSLEHEVKARSRAGSIDCGHVALGGDRSTTDRCVAEAFRTSKAFHARYEQQGADSHVAAGVVAPGDGTVTFLNYDGDPAGGGGDAEPVVSASVCEGATPRQDVSTPGALPFECMSLRMLGRICE